MHAFRNPLGMHSPTTSARSPFSRASWTATCISTNQAAPSGRVSGPQTRAAAAGGYTTLVDMPLNCLPETTSVAALETKRAAAGGQCFVDWAAWGGVAGDNAGDIEPLSRAGVKGYKCFLVYPGCEGFQMVSLAQLETALPHVARTGLPFAGSRRVAGADRRSCPLHW